MKICKSLIILLLSCFLIFTIDVSGQKISDLQNEINLTIEDSIYSSNLPRLEAPLDHKLKSSGDLPAQLDNYTLPFFRPNFSQQSYWNCGQSAGVGYNFTYEINVKKGVSGDTSINQYSPNFTFNFMNHGRGWGVSYFNSFEAIAACGNPNLYDYGPLFNVGFLGWKSGYSLYENAMKNRITGVYAIDVGTPEGLLLLKNWLYDHLDGSEYGGVANYYLGGNSKVYYLPPESPGAGYSVNIDLNYPATHAMTITGYNDSVRFDINNDGKFTNNLDITGDGLIDMSDWEIGALKYMNSSTFNDGQGYLMYRALALPYGKGGPWNQQMHVIKVDDDYSPLAIMRLKINHNSRNKIKIVAGVSTNMNNHYPDYTMDFPIFNFQGGDKFMQGADTSENNKELEFSLDISPLFSHIISNTPAKFFVQVVENDKYNAGSGEILYYAIVKGAALSTEIIECTDVPKEIIDNAITTLELSNTIEFDKVHITTNEIPKLEPNQTQSFIIEAQGGYPPYSWNIENNYSHNGIENAFSEITEEKLIFDNNIDSYDTVDLPFSFPFYGDTVQRIYISVDGAILFKPEYHPYPYFVGESSQLKNVKMVAPFLSNLYLIEEEGDGVWIEKNSDNIIIRWKATNEFITTDNKVNFETILYNNGVIENHYGKMKYPENEAYVIGVSKGDKNNFIINSQNQKPEKLQYTSVEYKALLNQPEALSISNYGELTVNPGNKTINHPVTIAVKDSKGITNKKTFLLTQSDLRLSYSINNQENNIVDFDQEPSINLIINNTSITTYKNLRLNISCNDDYIILNDSSVNIGEIGGGQQLLLDNLRQIKFKPDIPDQHNSKITFELTYDGGSIINEIILITNSPKYLLLSNEIIDQDNSFLYPGETAIIKQTIQNIGHAKSNKVFSTLSTSNNNLFITEKICDIKELNTGDTVSFNFDIGANWQLPLGERITIDLTIFDENDTISRQHSDILIGHVPVLIFENDQFQQTGLALKQILDEVGLNYDYYLNMPNHLDNYLSVFVCLGGMFNLNSITAVEEQILINYLNSNGNVYLEGRKKWESQQQTSLLSMFNIVSDSPGPFQLLDTIFGTESELTKNMVFTNDDNAPVISVFLHPVNNAISILKTSNNDTSDVTIAYDAGSYKTIGSNILFGSLVETDSLSTKKNYLISILDFFGIKKYIYVGTNKETVYPIDIAVFPNPSDGNFSIVIKNELGQPSIIKIIDLFGRNVYSKTINETAFNKNRVLSIERSEFSEKSLLSGIYILQLNSGSFSANHKIIIQ